VADDEEAAMDLIATVLPQPGEPPIEPELAAKIVELVVDLVDTTEGPPSTRLVDAVEAVARRTPDEVIAALADWWAVATDGRQPTGSSWQLDAVDPLWREPIEALRDFGRLLPEGTALFAWLRDHAELTAALDELAVLIDYRGGNYALAGERAAWGQLEGPYAEFLTAVRAGAHPEPPETRPEAARKAAKFGDLKPGSDRFKYFLHLYDDVVNTTARVALLAERVNAKPGLQPPEIDVLEAPRDPDARSRVARCVLRRLTGDAPPDVDDVGSRLDAAGTATSDAGRAWLASASLDWHREHSAAVPSLEPVWATRRALLEELRHVQHAADDTQVAALRELIEDGEDLDTAREMLDDLKRAELERSQRQSITDRLARLTAEVQRFSGPTRSDLHHKLQLALADVADERLDDARRALDGLTEELRDARQEAIREQASDLLNQLQELQAAGSVVAETEARLESDDELSWAVVDDLSDLLTQSRAETRRRLVRLLDDVTSRLEAARPLLAETDVLDVDDSVARARDALRGDDFERANDALSEASALLDRRAVREWHADAGEDELLAHVTRYLGATATFDETDVRRFHTALKSKPFVILAGLTGTGKSTIARLYAEALDATVDNNRFTRIAVRPNWIDETEVIGYLNPTTNRFEPGWLAALIRVCHRNPDLPVFCLLDEMNLAPVEHYLADVLTAMEETGSSTQPVRISLYSPGAAPENAPEWPSTMNYPTNLFVIGTVNMDETTRPLSDRVLDRANVVQLAVALAGEHHTARVRDATPEPRWRVTMGDWDSIASRNPIDVHHEFLVEVARAFADMRIGLGVRAHLDIERFCSNAIDVLDETDALDLALLQRVVPKIRGFKADLAEGLQKLEDLFSSVGAERCAAVIADWLDTRTSDDTFIDGTAARGGLVRAFAE
jgi:hypothetical protein